MDIKNLFRTIFSLRWNPGLDLAAVLLSWLLVTGSLYTATVIVTPELGGGMPYFFLYAVLTATIFGVGIPLLWLVVYRKRPIQDLGITTKYLGLSIVLQLGLAAIQYVGTLAQVSLPPIKQLLPLLALALTIGFFEALFWRGWVLLRLEESFGLIPAILIGSLLYAAYHIGYAMPISEIYFLFFIGVLYAVCFRLTRNIFLLWPIFQPMGQLVTLSRDQLQLPLIASVGFIEVLVIMGTLVWLANRHCQKHQALKKGQTALSI
jgi:membrane protease YdiL (CAAX protease family)